MKYKAFMKKPAIIIPLLAIPLSALLFIFIDRIMSSIMGGVISYRGFPLIYYKDDWRIPGVEYNNPSMIGIDIALMSVVLTTLMYILYTSRKKR